MSHFIGNEVEDNLAEVVDHCKPSQVKYSHLVILKFGKMSKDYYKKSTAITVEFLNKLLI
jgi:hypothetical protein